jgi:DNA-directed RNA polymerase specialized sigma24 family protein
MSMRHKPARHPSEREMVKDSAAEFERVRGRLFGLAYRMVGARADAEDLVQEAYMRWHEADHDRIENAEAWLITTTTRLAIDRLRRLKTEREAYSGTHRRLAAASRSTSQSR